MALDDKFLIKHASCRDFLIASRLLYKKSGQKMAKNCKKFSKYGEKWALDLRPQMFLELLNG
ncbi:hypothetical protein DOM21_03680 [Bacteriovorax stolpii]|nr:hypothetical protein DOM21_03680 [Bacteriovorax stolpii]